MKKLIMILMIMTELFFATKVIADGDNINEWDIYRDKFGEYLGLKAQRMKMIKLKTVGPDVELIKVSLPSEVSNIAVIHYKAGSAGTSSITEVYRAVIFDYKKNEFIGQAPVRRDFQDGQSNKAKWKYEEDLLIVNDSKEGKLEFKL